MTMMMDCPVVVMDDTFRYVPNFETRKRGDKQRYIGDQLEQRTDLSGLLYKLTTEKGFVVDWELQREIWDRILLADGLNICCKSNHFRDKDFCLVIDSGRVRRMNVGGRLLTNHLKETISFRQWNMMEETSIVNDVKEDCCYVAVDLETQIQNAMAGKVNIEYVLPDFKKHKRGKILTFDAEMDQTLRMGIERFMVPEVLFNPSDIGLPQAGIPESVVNALESFGQDVRGLFYNNIVVCGGNFNFRYATERLVTENASTETDVKILKPASPTRFVWDCGSEWASLRKEEFLETVLTRAQYEEGMTME
ncbi:hypothetical protein BC829DRAFT_403880 [Chytridium lagenaria]|nr:hypothetical protein BC829DRAFT_403880 [Chytridium lagenaria]